tara:strand:- start:3236 stop:3388 length:153 start_codon:yes stop_codon:yes gene_type:complete
MKMWYQEKAKFHYKQWEVATEQGKEKAANAHMVEYLNYKEMEEIEDRRTA